MSGNKLIKNTAIYALGDIFPRLLGFITFPILTSFLSPADYGILSYVAAINNVLSIVGLLCLNTYYLVYYFKMENEYEQRKLLGNLSIFIFILNVVITVILLIVGIYINQLDSMQVKFYPFIALAVVTNLFNLMSVLPTALFRVRENPTPLVILNIIKAIMIAVATVALVAGFGYKAEGILYATMVIAFIFTIIFGVINVRNMEWVVDFKQIGRALKFSLPLMPGTFAFFAMQMSDRMFIEHYLDLTQLGIYATATTLAMTLQIIGYGAYKAFEPHFFKTYGKDGFLDEFKKVYKVFFLVLIFGAMGLSIFAQEFFMIFAAESYSGVYIYVPMVQIAVLFSCLSMMFGTIITAREKTKINSAVAIVGAIISASLNIVLLRYIGIVGACISSAVTFAVILVFSVIFSKIRLNYMPSILSFLVACGATIFVVYFLPPNNVWINILIKIATFCGAMLFILKILNVNLATALRMIRNKN